MADIFISYARADVSWAEEIAQALTTVGYSVFYDSNLIPGEGWDQRIERELNSAAAVIVLWSTASRDRQWVRNEARIGNRRGILCPVLIDSCEIPVEFSHLQAADLRRGSLCPGNAGWDALLGALQNIVRRGVVTPLPATHRATPTRTILAALITTTVVVLLVLIGRYRSDEGATSDAPTTAPAFRRESSASSEAIPNQVAVTPERQGTDTATIADEPRRHESAGQSADAATTRTRKVTTPPSKPFDVNLLSSNVRLAVERARSDALAAEKVAEKAREMEAKAEQFFRGRVGPNLEWIPSQYPAIEGHKVVDARLESGWWYSGQWSLSSDRADGYGILGVTRSPLESQPHYNGEMRTGEVTGFGVFYEDRSNEAGSQYDKTEGQWVNGTISGCRVRSTRSWTMAYCQPDAEMQTFVVLRYSDGTRYEGQFNWETGRPNGYGVKWNRDGTVMSQGLYKEGVLVIDGSPTP